MFDRMPPVHPGEILSEDFLKPMALSQTQLALATGMPQSRVQAIVAGRRGITADTAIRLAAFFGNTPQFWLNCQTSYELDMADYTGEEQKIRAFVRPRSSSIHTVTA
ncbi:HigA family addiction module antitoxin [Bilophila wadsworthia]|uniref:HigA family addiction module antitoxin n=1 Tax=Bilophila wadsworthia TaxID=35833 RepID=UPI0026767F71|nr:HigA family addiction module antitoxin [Bilophila wadsworthia]